MLNLDIKAEIYATSQQGALMIDYPNISQSGYFTIQIGLGDPDNQVFTVCI